MVDINFSLDDLVSADEVPELDKRGERLHALYETVFGFLGPALLRKGWSCFPQQRTERRKPSVVDKVTLKWKAFQDRLPSEYEMRSWSLQCPDENVAIITGPASGNLFALDLDINDIDLLIAIRDLALEHLGATPFVRHGRFPRVIMLYRHLPDSKMRKRSYHFGHHSEDGVWAPSGDAIEFIANGSPFTAYGTHYRTGNYFKWSGAEPWFNPPTDAPLVTPEQIEAFIRAVQEIRPFYKGTSSAGTSNDGSSVDLDAPLDFDVSAHGVTPRGVMTDAAWVVEDGRVIDGTHAYMLELSRRIVCGNEHAFDAAVEDRTAADRLMQWAAAHLREVRPGDGRRSHERMTQELGRMLQADIEKFNTRGPDGRRGLAPIRTHARADGRRVAHRALTTAFPRDAALHWLGTRSATVGLVEREVDPDAKGAKGVRVRCLGVDVPTPEKVAARALGGDRSAVHARVQDGNAGSLDAWLDDVQLVPAPDEEGRRTLPPWRLHLNLLPPGAGKSTLATTRIANLVKAEKVAGKPYAGPIVFSPPSHANIFELVAKARSEGMEFHTDVEAEADDAGLEELVAQATALGIRAVHLKSKVLAGCYKEAQLRALMAAGMSTSGMCRAKRLDAGGNPVRDDRGEQIEDFCVHYAGETMCGHRQQIEALETADVVYAAHAHITNQIPAALKAARGLLVDESILHQILATGQVTIAALFGVRPAPPFTKADLSAIRRARAMAADPGLTQVEVDRLDRAGKLTSEVDDADREAHVTALMDARRDAAELAAKAHADRFDITDLFIRTSGALAWARTAKRIAGACIALSRRVHPSLTLKGIEELALRIRPAEAEMEWRFWDTLIDGCERGIRDGDPRGESDDPLPLDTRLQPVIDTVGKGAASKDVPSWRVSWRRGRNWLGVPTLLLDATGDVRLTELLNPKAEVVPYRADDVTPNLRVVLIADRTYSPSGLYPDKTDLPKFHGAKATRKKVRRLIAMAAGAHGHGQILLTMPKGVREQWEREHALPRNAKAAHYGALRGLDWARAFLASLGIGRSEQSVRVVDGLVAAATYDTCPEHPFDRFGNGRTAEGEVLYRPQIERVVRMRTGHDLRLAVPQIPTEMGRRVEAMWREAEILQFVGRLRGIYREAPGTVILLCDCPPEGLVVDDVLTLDEALGDHAAVWEVAGAVDGVMVPGLTDALTGLPRADVERFVRRYRDWPAMRVVSWTDAEGTLHEGIMPAWHRDVRAALRTVGATDEVLDLLDVPEDRVEVVPIVDRAADNVDLAVAIARDAAEVHYAIWQVSHPFAQGETEWGRRRRFEGTYDPSDYLEGMAPPTVAEVPDVTMEATC